MKNLSFILSFVLIVCCISCSDDDDPVFPEDYVEVELQGTCSYSTDVAYELEQTMGVVVVYKDKEIADLTMIYLKAEDGKYYLPCMIPEKYHKTGLKVAFEGKVMSPDPLALTVDPLNGATLDITKFWVAK